MLKKLNNGQHIVDQGDVRDDARSGGKEGGNQNRGSGIL